MGSTGSMGPTVALAVQPGHRRVGWRALAAATAAALAAGSLAVLTGPADAAVLGQNAAKAGTLVIEAPGVTFLKKGKAKFAEAKTRQKIKTGDTIQTDGTGLAEIAFPDGSLTRLDHDTVFTLERLSNKTGDRRVESTVSAGQTWNRVQKLSESDTFEQGAKGATAAVLGTAFLTRCSLPAGAKFKAVKTKKALKKLKKKAAGCEFTLIDGQLRLSAGGRVLGLGRGQSVGINTAGVAGDTETVPPDILFTDPWILSNLAADDRDGKAEANGDPTLEDLKQARIEGSWPVTLTVLGNDGFRDLAQTRNRTYTFAGSCSGGTCAVTLTRETATGTSVIPLAFSGGVYTGTDPDLGVQNCVLDDGTVAVPNGLQNSGTISFTPAAAIPSNGLWRATALTGTVTETATPAAGTASQCVSATATFGLAASR